MRLGVWLRSGQGMGWLETGLYTKLSYRVPFLYFIQAGVFVCRFVSFSVVLFCSCWNFVDVSLIFFRPADHVPDWQPRIFLGMVKARSVNVKTTIYSNVPLSLF